MHDPLTVAFEIKRPWPTKSVGYRYYPVLIRIWHKDPCKDGTDDSCDWWGRKRKLNAHETALLQAIYNMEPILDNSPFYPEHEAHLRFQKVQEAKWKWLERERFRWPVRWHLWHWRIQVPLWQTFYRWAFKKCCICKSGFGWDECVIGNWSGDAIWHHGCNHKTYVLERHHLDTYVQLHEANGIRDEREGKK